MEMKKSNAFLSKARIIAQKRNESGNKTITFKTCIQHVARSWFNYCVRVVNSMPQQDALKGLYQLLHFVNDWELG